MVNIVQTVLLASHLCYLRELDGCCIQCIAFDCQKEGASFIYDERGISL
jgi:hypothetical protein